MKKNIKSLANQKLQGQVGENAVWDGPLSKEGFQYTENSVLKKCPKKSEDPLTLADIKELNRISDDATIAEEEDNMEDINSTGEFIESLDKKNAAELKQQKTDFANNPSIMNTMKKFKYLT